MRERQIRAGYRLRLGRSWKIKNGSERADTLYFDNIRDAPKDKAYRLSSTDVIDLHEFLGRFIQKHIKKSNHILSAESRAHARAIERNMLTLESRKP